MHWVSGDSTPIWDNATSDFYGLQYGYLRGVKFSSPSGLQRSYGNNYETVTDPK